MEILLAHEVDIDQEDLQHGTPLYVACTYQRTDCVRKLLELGTPGKGAGGELRWCEPTLLVSPGCLCTADITGYFHKGCLGSPSL